MGTLYEFQRFKGFKVEGADGMKLKAEHRKSAVEYSLGMGGGLAMAPQFEIIAIEFESVSCNFETLKPRTLEPSKL
jgi:hypothetical protein